MAEILELSDWEFKTTTKNMLRALMVTVESMQEQKGKVSREMDILRKNQKEMLEIKITVIGIKNDFNTLFSRMDMAEERISELENILIGYPQTRRQRK